MKALIDRTLARWTEVKNKEFYYIVTCADTDKAAQETTLACFRGYADCVEGAEEKGVIYGTGVYQPGEIKMPLNRLHEQVYLVGRKCRGGPSSDIEGADRQTGAAQSHADRLNFAEQAVEIGRQERTRPALRLADEGAIGAARGAEGDADINRHVAADQPLHSRRRGKACLHAELPARGSDKEGLLQQPVGTLGRTARE